MTPRHVVVGGLSGDSLDIKTKDGASLACGGSVPLLIDTSATPGTGLHWGAAPSERYRLIVLDTGDRGTITISIYSAHPDGWDAFVAAAQSIVESMEFAAS